MGCLSSWWEWEGREALKMGRFARAGMAERASQLGEGCEHGRIQREAAGLMGRGQVRNGTRCQGFEIE